MGTVLSLFLQILLYTAVPVLVLGLAVWFSRRLFIQLIGAKSGRAVLKACFALSSPLREAGHVAMAVLFWHRIEDARFLNLKGSHRQMGYTEHSYNPRNPVALLGNFFFALGPALVGLVAVLIIFLACFGGVMESFFTQISALSGTGSVADYLRAGASLIPQMFLGDDVGAFAKVVGALLLVFLCMGICVSLKELSEGLSGAAIYAGIAFLVAVVLSLLDERVQRVALTGLRAFATGVLALYLPVLLAVAVLLIFAAIFFLVRKLGDVPETGNALVPYQKNDGRE